MRPDQDPVAAGRKGGKAPRHMAKRRKNLRECAMAVLEGQIPITARENLPEDIASLGTAWEAIVALVTRDGLNGNAKERVDAFRALRDLLPRELEIENTEAPQPHLDASEERQRRLMRLLRESDEKRTPGNGADSDQVH